MRIRFRPQTTERARWTWAAIRACASGLLLAGAAAAVEGPDSGKATPAAPAFVTPAEARLKADVTYLAADEREGREPGTRGIEEAADYIANVFKDSGLKPAPGADGYFQPFTISTSTTLGDRQEIAFDGPEARHVAGKYRADFTPLAIGIGEELKQVPIAFAGYGITVSAAAGGLAYDDYADIDVKNKAVLILRREPVPAEATDPFHPGRSSRYATFQHKATNAYQHGAAAVLLVNDRAGLNGEKDSLLRFEAAGSEPLSRIPFVMLTREFADRLLSEAGEPSLADLESRIDSDLKPKSRDLRGWTLGGRVTIDHHQVNTKNVIGVLEGAGPHADETIVVGGHYDHLGHGGLMSGSMAFFSRDIHNGADDNASGTSMVLELARRMGARRDPPPRRIVFMAFSGEERGLLGSQYYVDHPLIPLASTVMMFNCDMVGRLSEKNELTMIGTGTSPGLNDLVQVLGKSSGLTIKTVAGMTDGFGGSDHQSFYPRGIPVLFAFTGVHRDYHRPSDDSHLINYPGMARIADYLELLLLDVVRRPERPAYARIEERQRGPRMGQHGPPGTSAFLGVRIDTAWIRNSGVRVDDVSKDSPAAKGGIKAGDVIKLLGGKNVGSVADFLSAISSHRPGDVVELGLERDGKELGLRVTLGTAPAPAGAADPARSVYVGTMPDYSDETGNGMKIQGVMDGSPAEKGGLKGGDTIIRFAGKPIGTIHDYMETMNQFKPGDEVEIVVKRDGREVKLRVKLGSRGGR